MPRYRADKQKYHITQTLFSGTFSGCGRFIIKIMIWKNFSEFKIFVIFKDFAIAFVFCAIRSLKAWENPWCMRPSTGPVTLYTM